MERVFNVHDIPTDAVVAVSLLAHLLQLNILPWIEALTQHLSRIKLLLTHSKASVASVPAASFCERVNSPGGIVSTKGNVNMDPEEISHWIPLRMNGSFWTFTWATVLGHLWQSFACGWRCCGWCIYMSVWAGLITRKK